MRKLLFLLLALPLPAWTAGNDTLPLQRKTPGENKAEPLLAPKAGNAATEGAPEVGPVIGSIGTYGSPRVNEVILKELLGKEMDLWIAKGLASDPSALDLERKFVDKIKKKFGFPFVEWSIIQYFEPEELTLHLTLDVVEKGDVSRRMPFLPEPTETVADPGGVIAKWVEYENLALDLVEAGDVEPEAQKCAALHCPFGHQHAKLKPYEAVFLAAAKKHSAGLEAVMKKDKSPENRAAAAYVFAYQPEKKKQVVDAMVALTRDPDPLVRNNALRVLGDIAEYHTDTPIPYAPLLPALDYPKVSDRSKALYVLYLMALNSSQVREALLKSSVPNLIALMENKQPDHKELAHNILRKVSGKEFPDTDARAWTAWYSKLPKHKDRAVSKK